MDNLPRSIYVHIPFCYKRCGYCDFITFSGRDAFAQIDAYFEALHIEIDTIYTQTKNALGPLPTLDTIYFGGGTPTAVPVRHLQGVLDHISKLWNIDKKAEITVEANPASVNSSVLKALLSSGFNRLSMGLQATQSHLLEILGRVHDLNMYDKALDCARSVGFVNISTDLMFGIPNQTLADVEETMVYVLSKDLPHYAFYSLIIEEDTPFFNLYGNDGLFREDLPSEDLDRDQYELARAALENVGLYQYEISNYAKPGFESRHNLMYWDGLPYFGFGVGAHSFLQDERRSNGSSLESYIQRVMSKQPIYEVEEVLSKEGKILEFFLLGFRKVSGVYLDEFRARFQENPSVDIMNRLQTLKKRGLLDNTGDNWFVTREGFNLANQIFMMFIP